MANIDKNIIITPYISGVTQPQMKFVGQGNDPIYLKVLDGITGTGATAGGALSIEGSAGQLFSIVNRLGTGSIFSVNDISGIPMIDANASGNISIAGYFGNVGVGLTAPTEKFQVTGNAFVSGLVTAVSGISAAGGVTLAGTLQGTTATFSGDIAVNGGDITTTATTATLFNANATTLNILNTQSSGFTLNIGNETSFSGTKTINIAGNLSGGAGAQITIGSASSSSKVSILGGITLGGVAGASVRVANSSSFEVSSISTFSGNVAMTSTSSHTGLASFSGGLSAAGGITFSAPISSTRMARHTSAAISAQKTADFTPTAAEDGTVFYINYSGKGTLLVTLDSLPIGWRAKFLNIGNGTVLVDTTGDIYGYGATNGLGEFMLEAICIDTNTYFVG
jgi:hypothetical protein